jgi:hypothetical protein
LTFDGKPGGLEELMFSPGEDYQIEIIAYIPFHIDNTSAAKIIIQVPL